MDRPIRFILREFPYLLAAAAAVALLLTAPVPLDPLVVLRDPGGGGGAALRESGPGESGGVQDAAYAEATAAFGILLLAAVPLWFGGLVILARRRGEAIFPGRTNPPPPWALWDVVKVASVILLFYLVCFHAIALVATMAPSRGARGIVAPQAQGLSKIAGNFLVEYLHESLRNVLSRKFAAVAMTLGVQAVGLVLIVRIIHQKGASVAALGLSLRKPGLNVLRGATGLVLVLPIILMLSMFSAWLMESVGQPVRPHPTFPMLRDASWAFKVFLAAQVLLIGPVVEEAIFRGFIHQGLRACASMPAAAVTSALLFASVHPVSHGLPIFALGVLLAYLFEAGGSLVAPIAAHSLFNGLMLSAYFLTV